MGWQRRLEALKAGVHWIDVESDEDNVCDRIDEIHDGGGKALLSHHVLSAGNPFPKTEPFESAVARADLIKVIGTGSCFEDFCVQRRIYSQFKKPLIHFFMGAEHASTRILSLVYGAPFTFASLDSTTQVAPGQLIWNEALNSVTAETHTNNFKLFAVAGSPIAHSRSPLVHRPALQAKNANALFLALPVANQKEWRACLRTFPELHGLAITKPLKEIACQSLNTYAAGHIGMRSINTLTKTVGGWQAANTDFGAIHSYLKELPVGQRVRVLGYGGLGKAAIAAGLVCGHRMEVCNRTLKRVSDLPDKVQLVSWEERHRPGPQVVIQATSVGMHPHSQDSPMEKLPAGLEVVIESVYHPRETKFIQLAKKLNVKVISGIEFFERQAQLQSKFFVDTLS